MAINNILNFVPISNTIATAGQPTEEQFAAIKDAGYQIVVNLALTTSTNAIPREQQIVESQGMQYIHIPVLWENPTQANLDRFFQVMRDNADKRIFVHCAMNMRVSAFVYLYRRIQESIDDETAKQDLHQIWAPNKTWQEFIERMLETYQSEQ